MRMVLALLLATASARADVVTIRMAGIAPDGASFTRELKAFARDIEVRLAPSMRVFRLLGPVQSLIVANRVFDTLFVEDQQILRDAGARLKVRIRDLGKTQDQQLIDEHR
jgi:TRAP-type C4-dicarboxylate transport system substrate-binding protein